MGDQSWWSIAGVAFLNALRRAHAGEDPDLLYAEYYANSQIERVDGGPSPPAEEG